MSHPCDNHEVCGCVDDPVMKQYNQEWNAWDDARMLKYESEQYLQKCPECRR